MVIAVTPMGNNLLGLGSKEETLGHPVVGQSWEGFVIENLINVAPHGTESSFYRASGGAEIDLILALPGRAPWAIEVKRSLEPKVSKGFHHACEDIKPEKKFVVYPGKESYKLPREIDATGARELVRMIAQQSDNAE